MQSQNITPNLEVSQFTETSDELESALRSFTRIQTSIQDGATFFKEFGEDLLQNLYNIQRDFEIPLSIRRDQDNIRIEIYESPSPRIANPVLDYLNKTFGTSFKRPWDNVGDSGRGSRTWSEYKYVRILDEYGNTKKTIWITFSVKVSLNFGNTSSDDDCYIEETGRMIPERKIICNPEADLKAIALAGASD